MAKILGRDDLLSSNYLKRELVEFPDLGVSVYVRELSASQVLQFNQRVQQLKDDEIKELTPEVTFDFMTWIISLSVCDEDGSLLFSSEEDASKLKDAFGARFIDTLSDKAMEISRLKVRLDGLSTEVADNLPNDPMKSSLVSSHKSSRKRAKKS